MIEMSMARCENCKSFFLDSELLPIPGDFAKTASAKKYLGLCPRCKRLLERFTALDLSEIHDGSTECPVCGEDLEGGDTEFYQDEATIRMTCMSCGLSFLETYTRSGLECVEWPCEPINKQKEEKELGLCGPPDNPEED